MLPLCSSQPQVNFDAERFVDYITRADAYTQSIKTKLAQAGVKGRPSAAPLPWFDLQGSPLDFSLSTALAGKPVNAETLEELGMQVGAAGHQGLGARGMTFTCAAAGGISRRHTCMQCCVQCGTTLWWYAGTYKLRISNIQWVRQHCCMQ